MLTCQINRQLCLLKKKSWDNTSTLVDQKPIVYCTYRKHKHLSLFCKSSKPQFLSVYQSDNTQSRENTSQVYKPLVAGSWFTNFFRVLPTSCVGHYASKLVESTVHCLTNRWVFNQWKWNTVTLNNTRTDKENHSNKLFHRATEKT